MRKQFGGKITEDLKKQYARSKHWNGNKFVNLQSTGMSIGLKRVPKLLYKTFSGRRQRMPKQKIPIIPFDKEAFIEPSAKVKFIWYGHSVILLMMGNKNILIDPMLGPNAAPVAPFAIRRFSENTLEIIEQLPPIDFILLTHDHYDHLDYESIERLKTKVSKYCVALGCARHLVSWGINPDDIFEFDWWERRTFEEFTFTFTPSRHFSGRGFSDRSKSLWGGWAIKTHTENLYFSGDGGYGNHFKEIGDKLGPFDFAFMECGQYNENWHQIHMYPEESVQAAMDVKAKYAMPVHWGGFSLSLHHWKEPVIRFAESAQKNNLSFITPELGAIINLDNSPNSTAWYQAFE